MPFVVLLLNYLNILWMLMNLLLNNLLCTLHNVGITVANPPAPHFLLFKCHNVCLKSWALLILQNSRSLHKVSLYFGHFNSS